jgi:2Fe-2S ferredoxin
METFSVIFVEEDGTVKQLAAEEGQTLMEVGKFAGVEGLLAECGGVCACATCHVYIDEQWMPKIGPSSELEAGMLDLVEENLKPGSRLSCRILLDKSMDGLRVTVAPR